MILYYIEQGIGVSYLIKTLAKILLFVPIPFIYIKFVKEESLLEAFKLKAFDKRRLLIGLGFGVLFFLTILVSYNILGYKIDFEAISIELQSKLKVTPLNFIFVGIYITFGNSFLEEFFFRGFIFMNLHELGLRKLAYIYSSLLFALYHVIIFKTWFTAPIFLLALLGLASVGFIFNWMNTRSNNFLNSWIAHIFADTAIILIGLRMFKIV